jgi:hypothetical protein
VGDALEDWLAHGLDGLSPRTVTLYQHCATALTGQLGTVKLTELTAADVQGALTAVAVLEAVDLPPLA